MDSGVDLQKRFLRFVSCCLVCVMFLFSFAVPSFADTLSSYNLLDTVKSTISGITSGSNIFEFDYPFQATGYDLDVIVHTDGDLSGAFCNIYGTWSPLTVDLLGEVDGFNSVYRIRGSLSGENDSKLQLRLDFSSGTYVNFDKLTLGFISCDVFSTKILCNFSVNGGTYAAEYVSGNTASWTFGTGSSGFAPWSYRMQLVEWEKFDFIDVLFYTRSNDVTSIGCVGDDGYTFPLEISYINASSSTNSNTRLINIRVDLRGYSGSGPNSDPSLEIYGNINNFVKSNFVGVMGVSGLISVPVINPWYTRFSGWFSNLGNTFQTLFGVASQKLTDIFGVIVSSFDNLKMWISDQTSSIRGYFTDLKTFLTNLLNPSADTSAGDTLVDKGNQIHDFESGHQDVLTGSYDTLAGAAAVGTFSSALAFVSGYTTKVFNELGDFQVVYTLPLVLGLILFLCSRVPYNTHPNKSSSDSKVEVQRTLSYQKELGDGKK